MIGLCRGLAYQAYKETNAFCLWGGAFGLLPAEQKWNFGMADRRAVMAAPDAMMYQTSKRYYQLLDMCRLRMRP